MLDLKFMPERTRLVYDALSREPLMDGFILIGGTALSIQIKHRLSEDLDFWIPAEKMSKNRVAVILANLNLAGIKNESAIPSWKIQQAKINGSDLLSMSQDHVVEGVKVTFFARGDIPYRHFAGMPMLKNHATFDIAYKDTIFHMKSWLLSQRVRSRDLLDLMELVKSGRSIRDILEAGKSADPTFLKEYAKDVLVGTVPLDKEDEGFNSIGVKLAIEEIYEFFLSAVNEYELLLAMSIVKTMTI